MAADTDSIARITAWLARSMVLSVLGREAEAKEAARGVRDLAAAKGEVNLIRRAEALIGR